VTTTATITAASNGATALSATAATLVSGSGVQGNNTASWDPMLTVDLPSNNLAGTYDGTVTTSVA